MMKGGEQLYLWGSYRSSLIRNHSAWPATSYYPGLLQHTGGCCNSSGQSSGTSTKTQIQLEVKMSSCCEAASWDASCHSRRVHRSTSSCRCPRGFFCLIRSKTSAAHVPLTPCGPHHHLGHHHHHHITYDQRCSDPPKDFVEDLQDELLLLVAADAQQVGSMSLAEQVCLQPA